LGDFAEAVAERLVALDVEPAQLEEEAQQVGVGEDGLGEGRDLPGATSGLKGVKVALGGASAARAFGGGGVPSFAWHGSASFRWTQALLPHLAEIGFLSRPPRDV
jgi:hypothetical protein